LNQRLGLRCGDALLAGGGVALSVLYVRGHGSGGWRVWRKRKGRKRREAEYGEWKCEAER
jgi:hypothetical protein